MAGNQPCKIRGKNILDRGENYYTGLENGISMIVNTQLIIVL
jgi:hypothetical protein